MNGLGRVKEWIKFFTFLFSVMLLTQRIRKSCPQSEIFSLGGQYYGLDQSNAHIVQAYGTPKIFSLWFWLYKKKDFLLIMQCFKYFFLCINCRIMRHFFANLSFAAIYAITLWTPPFLLFALALVVLYSFVFSWVSQYLYLTKFYFWFDVFFIYLVVEKYQS